MYDIYENKRYRDNFKIKSNIQLRVEYFKSSGKKQAVKMIFYFRRDEISIQFGISTSDIHDDGIPML